MTALKHKTISGNTGFNMTIMVMSSYKAKIVSYCTTSGVEIVDGT